ncbi:MAG: lactate utilization protein [Christensenellaceae bacterium]|nr:lactate utilization protein [Christensenellaceae bacterium]MBS6564039.1 lactate utilization protein [Clostridiales bacterium]PWL97268.1 MAG: lactate utilization protein [Selenomonadales bacterium]
MGDDYVEKYSDILQAFRNNNMEAYYAPDKASALEIIKGLIKPGETIACGGSMTLKELDVRSLINNGQYKFLDRDAPGLSREDVELIFRKAFFADTYIMSSNAVLRTGELYNVDGNSNRVAALCFGPKSVIVAVGRNKIVDNLTQAIERIRLIAAPLNAKRLNCGTYCASKGKCIAEEEAVTGCNSDARICCSYVLTSRQRNKGRIKVIIIDEELGF